MITAHIHIILSTVISPLQAIFSGSHNTILHHENFFLLCFKAKIMPSPIPGEKIKNGGILAEKVFGLVTESVH